MLKATLQQWCTSQVNSRLVQQAQGAAAAEWSMFVLLMLCVALTPVAVDKSTTAQLQEITKAILASCVRPPPAAAAGAGAGAGAATSTAAAGQALVRASAPGLQLWPTYAWSSAGAPQQTSSSSSDNTSEQQLPLHMSISRTVPIKRIQIESLQAALSKQLKPFKAFKVQLQGLVCLVNDAKARSFVGLRVSCGEKQVSPAHACPVMSEQICQHTRQHSGSCAACTCGAGRLGSRPLCATPGTTCDARPYYRSIARCGCTC